jgi:dimethylargininase
VAVDVKGCLHLKTAITSPTDGLLLANPRGIDVAPFARIEVVSVPDAEPWGANTLSVDGRVFVATSAPRTVELLTARGLDVRTLDISELHKAEAGLTCLSVLYRDVGHSSPNGAPDNSPGHRPGNLVRKNKAL